MVRGAILDKNVVVPDGALVGVDLATDRARYTVSAGGVVVLGKGDHGPVARSGGLDRGEEPVAEREQHRHQPLVLAHLAGHLPEGCRIRHRPGPGRSPAPSSTPSITTIPPGRSSRTASSR